MPYGSMGILPVELTGKRNYQYLYKYEKYHFTVLQATMETRRNNDKTLIFAPAATPVIGLFTSFLFDTKKTPYTTFE